MPGMRHSAHPERDYCRNGGKGRIPTEEATQAYCVAKCAWCVRRCRVARAEEAHGSRWRSVIIMVSAIEENKRGQMPGSTSYGRETQTIPPSVEPVTEPGVIQERVLSPHEPLLFLSLVVTGATLGATLGLSTLVLTILGLSGVLTAIMLPVSGITLGAAFLMLGAVDIAWNRMFRFDESETSWQRTVLSSGVAVILTAGIVAIVLSVVNLTVLTAVRFTAVAIIVLGLALLWHSRIMRRVSNFTHENLEGRRLSGPVAINSLSLAPVRDFVLGITGVILGILAMFNVAPTALGLVTLLLLGGALTLTSSTICGATLATLSSACCKSH
jgi:hypothetical protein